MYEIQGRGPREDCRRCSGAELEEDCKIGSGGRVEDLHSIYFPCRSGLGISKVYLLEFWGWYKVINSGPVVKRKRSLKSKRDGEGLKQRLCCRDWDETGGLF